MPVILGEVSILTTPLSAVRVSALIAGCLSFSLAASMSAPHNLDATTEAHYKLFHTFCMFVWCFFFTLSLLILIITFIQFHGLLPLSWKNLTATVSAMATLGNFTAMLAFPCALLGHSDGGPDAKMVAATIFSVLTTIMYFSETLLVRREQGGYMTSFPGLMKVLQVFGGTLALILVVDQATHSSTYTAGTASWAVWGSGLVYSLGLLGSLGVVLIMVGDCTGRCPLPFDRVLAGVNALGVLLYMVAAVISSIKVLVHKENLPMETIIVRAEMTFACLALLSYTIDLAYSVKLLCDRN